MRMVRISSWSKDTSPRTSSNSISARRYSISKVETLDFTSMTYSWFIFYMSLSDLRSTKKRSISVPKNGVLPFFRFGGNRKTHQAIISCIASKATRIHVFRVQEHLLTPSELGDRASQCLKLYVEREDFMFLSPNSIVF